MFESFSLSFSAGKLSLYVSILKVSLLNISIASSQDELEKIIHELDQSKEPKIKGNFFFFYFIIYLIIYLII